VAEITHFWDTDDTGATTSSTTVARTINASNFVAGDRYLFVWSAVVGGANTSLVAECRMDWATAGEIDYLTMFTEPSLTDADGGTLWSGYSVVTVPDPAENLEIFLGRAVGSGLVSIQNWRLLAINLDAELTENTDWYRVIDDDYSSRVDLTGSYASFASLSQSLSAGKWLILPRAQIDCDNIGSSAEVAYSASGGGITSETDIFVGRMEGGDTNELFQKALLPRVYDLNGTSFTFTVRLRGDGTSGHYEHATSEVIAISLDAFDEYHYTYNASDHELAATSTWEETLGLTPFTPGTANAPFALIGAATVDCSFGTGEMQNLRLQIGGTTNPSTADESLHYSGSDSTDEQPLFVLGYSDLAASSQDIDFDVWSERSTDDVWSQRGLLAWSLELASAGDTVLPSGIAGAATPGSHTVQVGAVTVSPQGISSGIAVPSPNLPMTTTVQPSAISSSAATGSLTVQSSIAVLPSGIDISATAGSPTVQPGNATVSPPGISGGVTVPSPSMALIATVLPSGIAGVLGTGGASVLTSGTVAVTGLASTAVIGAMSVLADQAVTASGIASGSALGAVSVLQSLFVQPSGLSATAVVGTPVLSSLTSVEPASVILNPAVGAASLNITVQTDGVASTVIVSTPVIDQLLQITTTGIASTAQLGTSTVIASRLGSGFYELATVPANDDDSGAGFFNTATVPTNDSNSGGGFFNS